MTRRALTALSLASLFALGLAADAGASSLPRVVVLHPEVAVHAAKVNKSTTPVVTKVTPLNATIGQQLYISGKNLRYGKSKTKVYFLRPGGGVAIATADASTKTRVTVTVPAKLSLLFRTDGKSATATRCRLRLLAHGFGPTTSSAKSTVISPSSSDPGSGTQKPACQIASSADSDNDGLTNATEINLLHTDSCKADTDGDGVPDGYEYQAALDLNNTTRVGAADAALPCPCKVPWPNPLDSTDAGTDHDGDGLTMLLEYQLNRYVHGPKVGSLQYSDGKQRSQDVPAPASSVLDYMNHIKFGAANSAFLSDDERDADNDGLTNWDECCGRMTADWWDKEYSGKSGGFPKETRYADRSFPEVDPMNPDSDGDGILDGADDQDHDGLSNAFEVSRPWDWFVTYVSTGPPSAHDGVVPDFLKVSNGGPIPDAVTPNPWARVQPYNPCKPVFSKTCHLYYPFGYYADNEDWRGVDPSTLGAPPAAPWTFDSADFHRANDE